MAAEALQRVGLKAAMDKRPDELSGGMRQRVAVARALAMRPKVLLMDEPFAALDVQTRARMQDFLLDVWRDSGASILFVTHHIDEAVALADRVVVFTSRPGRIKTIVPIDLPRPRNLFSREAEALRIQLTELLRDEVDRAFAEQEAMTARPDLISSPVIRGRAGRGRAQSRCHQFQIMSRSAVQDRLEPSPSAPYDGAPPP